MSDLSDIRREYTQGGLRRANLPANPMDLFEQWMQQAKDAQLSDPTAMCVATVDEDGQPFQRIVLLKKFDDNGFVFFTNLESRKAKQIAVNSKISLLFPWHPLDRQVAVLGQAEPLSMLDVAKYFMSRPKDSQIAAWVSKQSSKISARQALEGKFAEMKAKFAQGEVPLPKFWGGYLVRPASVEFWQGGEHRLHDRFIYTKTDADWNIDRLAP
ncbi:pyridoxamine 5'-phosphate oxidase [Shewanella sp. SR43-4]|jgi:pyridoxamine 5'-phosphate oxidase|uniref:Pyridoxine/pyridoxamine 5'-phosphate oxidase n=1 Tax=Shewanella vesiculosa TaxID=518738 RepID=A0ABV0FR05_9GAMM|nr:MULTISPECIES: pyridoxamine 5'-phosphate oxidase [Shewanella]NCQ45880.1 pyridoxamine 5'-phosphate oxidase [Shewanella frigidimarina]MBB1318996.1 pyridoxamine 5'-phosphate oxidase [Shewanella sp. SR43-4]MBB1323385.1 pyridoxamine 5'-phosphate oxidase [Shewanella sp. SR43-8]MBB1391360.1 pyridoxamine 5'-phosphate oxidase [Shewanella sp. SG44-6]MBB1476138.1 pyridoxamine 5'-phosphate oxidase [Shewanella sp. SG41-3]|tara:strand:+ start:8172 stop:8810 length:639 start_codon:yes stop_codon:yes gene_type:complete